MLFLYRKPSFSVTRESAWIQLLRRHWATFHASDYFVNYTSITFPGSSNYTGLRPLTCRGIARSASLSFRWHWPFGDANFQMSAAGRFQ